MDVTEWTPQIASDLYLWGFGAIIAYGFLSVILIRAWSEDESDNH